MMLSGRIQAVFRDVTARHRTRVIPFLTVGFPDVQTTMELVPALVGAGADIIELGVPFSDPLADGATIQKANSHALRQGVTLRLCLQVCATLRQRKVEIPLVLMGYYNQLLAFGLKAFTEEARNSGVDGLIVSDLPPEEAGPLIQECGPCGIDLICLLTPTSTPERVAAACAIATGFVYCVSLTGVTGARDQVSPGASQLVKQVRTVTDLPVAVGFGLSRRDHIESVGRYADAAVVGSALVNVIDNAPKGKWVEKASQFISSLTAMPETSSRSAQ